MVLAFFKLIRFKNLLMIGFINCLIRFVLYPKFKYTPTLSDLEFIWFVFSIICIAAAGNIINDYFDKATDAINKTELPILKFSTKSILWLFGVLNVVGIAIGIYFTLKINAAILGFTYIMSAIFLFLYSYKLKQLAFIGNLTVSFLIGYSIALIGIIDVIPSFKDNGVMNGMYLFYIILGLTCFSIVLNFIRELVKDIEDINGDYALDMLTLPIVIGRKRTVHIALALTVLTIITILWVVLRFDVNSYLFLYAIILLILPLIYFCIKVLKATTKSDYHKMSSLLKLIMLLGILSITLL
ncbi:geranylgeranylglycerol-phosphate geranylgeranyltransferase [Urechidicola sp. KH5]